MNENIGDIPENKRIEVRSTASDNNNQGPDNRNQGIDGEAEGYDNKSQEDNNYFRGLENDLQDLNQKAETFHEGSESRKLHVPVWVGAFLVLIIVLDIICMVQFPKVLSDYKIYETARNRINNADTNQAIDDLYSLAQKRSDSVPILVRAVDLAMQEGYYEVAGYILDNYLQGRSLSNSEYSKINSYYTKLNGYYTTNAAVTEIFKPLNQKTAGDVEINKAKTDLKGLLNQEGQDKASVYYYLAAIESDPDMAKDELLRCYELDPECFDVRSQLAVVLRRLGDFDEAKHYVQEALNKDKNDSSALRAMATIVMTQGNLEDGLKYAQAAYTSYPDGIYIRETYLIALTFNKMTEKAKLIQKEISDSGETLDDQTLQLLNGDITIEQYYLGE